MSEDNVIEMNSFLADSVWHPNNCKRCGQAYEPKSMMGKKMYFPSCECNDIIVKENEEERIRIENEVKISEQKALVAKRQRLVLERMHADSRFVIVNNEINYKKISEIIKWYIENLNNYRRPLNLILKGSSNLGKTFDIDFLFYQLGDPDFYSDTPETVFSNICNKKRTMDQYINAHWFCFDDIDKITNDHIRLCVFNILDGRKKAGLPSFATTNQDDATLLKNLQEPARNRIYDTDINGKDRAIITLKTKVAVK